MGLLAEVGTDWDLWWSFLGLILGWGTGFAGGYYFGQKKTKKL